MRVRMRYGKLPGEGKLQMGVVNNAFCSEAYKRTNASTSANRYTNRLPKQRKFATTKIFEMYPLFGGEIFTNVPPTPSLQSMDSGNFCLMSMNALRRSAIHRTYGTKMEKKRPSED
jgi:hypothetical protein